MHNVTTPHPKRTAFAIAANDGTIGIVERVHEPTFMGEPSAARQYKVYVMGSGRASAELTLKRSMLKLLLKGGARITGRVA